MVLVVLFRSNQRCPSQISSFLLSSAIASINAVPVSTPVLIGTWTAATWAIEFYKKHGFHLLSDSETKTLLRKYWNIPDRQIETSVVLANEDWKNQIK
jgi:hypothetical protein